MLSRVEILGCGYDLAGLQVDYEADRRSALSTYIIMGRVAESFSYKH